MFDPKTIVQLYQNAMMADIHQYNVPEKAIRIAIDSMAHVYRPNTVNLNSDRSLVADFNDVAHRCAYLHKYAAFHTAMVQELLSEAIRFHFDFFSRWVSSEENFKICSLGGGPGSDVIGALAALHGTFSHFPVSVSVVDFMSNWSYSFDSILKELGSGWYGPFGRYLCYHMSSRYVAANLLKSLTPEVIEALSDASLVTMIKFASAAACQDTKKMMKNIFQTMKPGAMVLFIDNDGGGFHEVFSDAAKDECFTSIYGPHRHTSYINESTKIKNFGVFSCFKTIVTVHIVQKPYRVEPYYDPLQTPYLGQHQNSYLDRYHDAYHSPYLDMHQSSYDGPYQNRRVLLGSPFWGSPPTPLLYQPAQLMPQNLDTTPVTPCSGKRKKINKKGCLPIRHFRHNLRNKMNKMKARVRSVIKKVKNPTHPIFDM